MKEYIKINEEQLGILQKHVIYLFIWQLSNFYNGNVQENLVAFLISASHTSDAAVISTGSSTQPFLTVSTSGQWLCGELQTWRGSTPLTKWDGATICSQHVFSEKGTCHCTKSHCQPPWSPSSLGSPQSLLMMTCCGLGLFQVPSRIYECHLQKNECFA